MAAHVAAIPFCMTATNSAFVREIVVFFCTYLAAIRIVQPACDRLFGIDIRFVVHVKRSPAHATANFVVILFGHEWSRTGRGWIVVRCH